MLFEPPSGGILNATPRAEKTQSMDGVNTYRSGPDERGHFGIYGGRYVAETLMPLILEVESAYDKARSDPAFTEEFEYYLKHYVGRPTPLYLAERLTGASGRREDLPQARRPQSTPARTRSTTRSARSCWPSAWARPGSSPKPAPDSTASPPPPCAPCSACSASSTWAPRTSSARPQRVPDEAAGRGGAAGHLRRGNPQGRHERGACATGWRTSTTPTT